METKFIRLAVIFTLLLSCSQISMAAESKSTLLLPKNITQNAEYMQEIESELQMSKQEYNSLTSSVSYNKRKLSELQDEIVSLQDQLNNLDFLADQTQTKIMNVMKQITQKRNDMQVLAGHIEEKNSILGDQLLLLKNYAKFLYVNDKEYLDLNRILLSGDSVAELLQKRNYVEILQSEGQKLAEDLADVSFKMDQNKKALVVKSVYLSELKERLSEEQEILTEQKEAKARFLEGTKGQEDIYFELLSESKAQQNSTLSDVNTLQNNLSFLQEKFKEFGSGFDLDNYRGLISKRSRAVFEYQKANNITSKFEFKWPVSPNRGISAYFLDASYKSVFGVPHYATDIRVPQLTPVHAPADGVVYRVKDNNMGYSYVILAHRNGLMTVYGHIYEIKTEEGKTVRQGDIIGLSGGMPGTKGAGYMTTGPHLHFEVIKNGKNVDPLDYLPLIQLPFDSLPGKYADRLKGEMDENIDSGREVLTEDDLELFVESEGKYGYEEELGNFDVEELIEFE